MKNAFRFAASAAVEVARALLVAALVVLPLSLSPSHAQFAQQSAWIATPGGTANAITLPVANWTRNYPGSPINFLPTAPNTTAVTIIVNGVGSPIALKKPGNDGLAALTGGELRAGQWATIGYDGTQFVLLNQLGQFVHASDLANSALSFGVPVNLQINATVSTNALTIALKTAAGSDPTATTPILIPFRDVTIANGGPVIVPVTAALSFTVASTNTMGCVSAQMCRLWIVAINNGGTAALCAFNALSGNTIAPINEAALQTSASGTAGGSSAQTYYCGVSAVTAKAIRILGYVEISEVTAGTWATGPTYTQIFGPGIKKPGDVVQTLYAPNGVKAQTTNTYSWSASLPTPAGGLIGASQAIVPQSAANHLRVTAQVILSTDSGSGSNMTGFIYDVTNSATKAATACGVAGNAVLLQCAISYETNPNTVSSITYAVYGAGGTASVYVNGTASLQFSGTSSNTFIRIEEIMGALPEPANDDGSTELRMIG